MKFVNSTFWFYEFQNRSDVAEGLITAWIYDTQLVYYYSRSCSLEQVLPDELAGGDHGAGEGGEVRCHGGQGWDCQLQPGRSAVRPAFSRGGDPVAPTRPRPDKPPLQPSPALEIRLDYNSLIPTWRNST